MATSPKVLCPTLDIMLKKTILALCEVNVKYDYKLEVCGSLHIRSDDQRVLTCLIDEQILGKRNAPNGSGLLGHIRKSSNPSHALVQPMKYEHRENTYEKSSYDNCGQNGSASMSAISDLMSGKDKVGLEEPMQQDDNAELSSLSSHYSKSPRPGSTENGAGALDLSQTAETDDNHDGRRSQDYSSGSPSHVLAESMAHTATLQTDLIHQQMAALNHMAEMMQRNIGMVLPTTHNPPAPDAANTPNNSPGPDAESVVKVEPTEPTPSAIPPQIPQMMVNPMQTAMVGMQSVDPLTIGNPVLSKTGAKKWQCVFCGILVSSKFYLSSHINAVHTRTRIYPCEMCGKLFYSHGAQRIHKLRNHWVEKRHKCPHCAQLFVLPFELRQHVSRKHKHLVAAPAVPSVNNNDTSTTTATNSSVKSPVLVTPTMPLTQDVQ